MVELNVLCNPIWKRSLHPFFRWDKQLKENGIKTNFYFDHKDKGLRKSENIFIYSKYFDDGWQNVSKRTSQNEGELFTYLINLKKEAGRLIWFDEAASSGSSDFQIINYVDVFAKKQVLKNINYYTTQKEENKLRIWVNSDDVKLSGFVPCPKNQLNKIKLAWNTSVYDYRYIRNKLMVFSNYLSYKIYQPKYAAYDIKRSLDVAFRGTKNYKLDEAVSDQRLKLSGILQGINLKMAQGGHIPKAKYLKELRDTKISISPFGFGEICYRDFETFISGSILMKPSLEHLVTLPNLFLPGETYIPFAWDLSDLHKKIEDTLDNHRYLQEIAKNGQDLFRQTLNNDAYFVESIKRLLS